MPICKQSLGAAAEKKKNATAEALRLWRVTPYAIVMEGV
jgi:hypothetical protein